MSRLASGLRAAGLGLALCLSMPEAAVAAELDGRSLSIFWAIPFVGILLSIALMPLMAAHTWEHHDRVVGASCLPANKCATVVLLEHGGPLIQITCGSPGSANVTSCRETRAADGSPRRTP